VAEVKDLIIGAAVGYDWDKLKYWVNSIRKSGFTGDVALVGTNLTKATIDKLTESGIQLVLYGKQQSNGDVTAPKNNAPHVERFFYIWNYLKDHGNDYRYVITTDTRDVVFQANPSEWLENGMVFHSLVASSEGMQYQFEPWGNKNLYDTFGPYFHDKLKTKMINNVGVIAGDAMHVRGLMLLIFQMSINRPIEIVDQAVYNLLINTDPFLNDTWFTTNDDGWAVQLGTTVKAVESGSGDLGTRVKEDQENWKKYFMFYEDTQPVFKEDGTIVNKYDKPFVVVHQWDRVPELVKTIETKFGD
jgi:hypothetical protein